MVTGGNIYLTRYEPGVLDMAFGPEGQYTLYFRCTQQKIMYIWCSGNVRDDEPTGRFVFYEIGKRCASEQSARAFDCYDFYEPRPIPDPLETEQTRKLKQRRVIASFRLHISNGDIDFKTSAGCYTGNLQDGYKIEHKNARPFEYGRPKNSPKAGHYGTIDYSGNFNSYQDGYMSAYSANIDVPTKITDCIFTSKQEEARERLAIIEREEAMAKSASNKRKNTNQEGEDEDTAECDEETETSPEDDLAESTASSSGGGFWAYKWR